MSLDFLRNYGALRTSSTPPLAALPAAEDEEEKVPPDLDLECLADEWEATSIKTVKVNRERMPRRFIDGSHRGETVVWMRNAEGHPVPVRLAEIGAGCIQLDGRRERAEVQRIVSFVADPFPWVEIEEFATALIPHGFRFLPCAPPRDEDGTHRMSFDFTRMEDQPRWKAHQEMLILEEWMACQEPEVPTLVDGRIGWFPEPGLEGRSIVGVIKSMRVNYLHPEGWRVLHDLKPGERTPAFGVTSQSMPVVTWYVKLAGPEGAMPSWGVVRVEIPRVRFDAEPDGWNYIDQLSRWVYDLRCRQPSYRRGPVSLEPIVRTEQSLGALMTPMPVLTRQFLRLNQL